MCSITKTRGHLLSFTIALDPSKVLMESSVLFQLQRKGQSATKASFCDFVRGICGIANFAAESSKTELSKHAFSGTNYTMIT